VCSAAFSAAVSRLQGAGGTAIAAGAARRRRDRAVTDTAPPFLEQAAQHPRCLLVNRQALRQQVGGRSVPGLVGQRQQAARGARHGFVAIDQDAHHRQCLGGLGGRVGQRTQLAELPGVANRKAASRA
jgi:hypothetical protein